jgi:hypothetical protein
VKVADLLGYLRWAYDAAGRDDVELEDAVRALIADLEAA